MSQVPIYTIGYGARDIDSFTVALKQIAIDYVIDVRSKPYSRYKPEFSKAALEQHLANEDIKYIFMGDSLGGQPDDPTCYDDAGKVDYDKCKQRPLFLAGIARLREAYVQHLRVALMCSEGKPENCHRAKLISEVLQQDGIAVEHIDERDHLVSHKEVMLRVIKGQPSLFGDEFFKHTSRKSYMSSDEEAE